MFVIYMTRTSSYVYFHACLCIFSQEQSGGVLDLIGGIFQDNHGELGQREGFSKKDIQKIRRMYKCGKRKRREY